MVERVLKDEDGLFKEELSNMKGTGAFASFYASLKDTEVQRPL